MHQDSSYRIIVAIVWLSYIAEISAKLGGPLNRLSKSAQMNMSKPVEYVLRDEIGHIVLDKVTNLANGEQGPVVLQPLPGAVQACR
jgi:hypothetical protein